MGESVALTITWACRAQLDTCPMQGHGHREGCRAGVDTRRPLRIPRGRGFPEGLS